MRNALYLLFCTFLFQQQQKHEIKKVQRNIEKIKNIKKTCFLNFYKKHKTCFFHLWFSGGSNYS